MYVLCFIQEIHFKYEDTYSLKENGENIYHSNTNQRKAGVAILISDRANFKVMKIIRDILHDRGFKSPRSDSNPWHI